MTLPDSELSREVIEREELVRSVKFLVVFAVTALNFTVSQESVKAGNGSGVASLPELDPEHDQTGVRVSAAHIFDEFNLFRPVLIRMTVRTVGTVGQRLQRPVVALAPAVNILAVGVVADGCFCDAIFLCI